jgi:hypothetical protein
MAALALATSPQPRKLRVGIFADARRQPRWLVEGLARVARSEFAEVVLIGIDAAAAARPRAGGAYARLDQWAFGAEPSEPLDLPGHVPHQVLIEGKIASVPDLDVAFALGGFDDAALHGVARLGVWRYDFDGAREVADGKPITGSRLVARLAAGAPARIAYESWSRTYPLSVARNRGPLLHKTALFAERALREAHRSGRAWLEQCKIHRENRGQSPISRTGGGYEGNRALTPILKIGGRILQRGVQKALSVDQWFLAFKLGAAGLDPALAGFTRLMPPKDRDWADPFVIEKGGRYYVFFEELPRAAGKAHIAMIEIDAEGRWSKPVPVLERDYHLSYPFLLEHDGALYMVPETAQNGTVEVYRCTDFPRRWRLERVLLEGVRLVDPTLHRGADRWWLFANAAPGESRVYDDELHLFHSPTLLGEWQPHPRNPVRSDARCARPAGRLFWRNGALHRPAQICAPRYGAGLAIQRVLRLTPHEYAERQVERVLPVADGVLGLHTLNRAGHLTVIDAFTRRRRI